jgi:hypothetical protein
MTRAPSMRHLRALAAPAVLEDDVADACYRVTAPSGRRRSGGGSRRRASRSPTS